MSTDEQLRQRLADDLAAGGHLRGQRWRRAVEAVPRHVFLRGGFFEQVPGSVPTAWRPVLPDSPGWLERCYADESLVTQIAGTVVPTDIRGEIMRAPTSSSTMPNLVVRMLEELQVENGQRALEIGTGTGYSTALLCHRLGDEYVTSVEVDRDVSARARTALGECGYFPGLVVGDGLAGNKDAAPYDRVVATCGVLTVPPAWIEQTRPGGVILATLCGWLYSSELARLTVAEDGTAVGRFLGGQISFMLARPQRPTSLGMLPDLECGAERPAQLGVDVLDDWTARFVAQLAAPRAQRITLPRDDRTEDIIIDVDSGSWAALWRDGERWRVRQGGPAPLWDAIEEHVLRWRADGAPPVDRFEITVTPEGRTVIAWPAREPRRGDQPARPSNSSGEAGSSRPTSVRKRA
ncbi:ATP-grasp peptide maturase system methyltransferase [Streptomyces silvisoli]|uniref:Protein-L-isoaspartate O-methyltransferase n=1 Tax=Streptomyces silvisoli TaxID=3034235 RepID=A0ABT5ZRC7_9ACTN|nr:ATP-grasp peptide maturase system methyltransferase [Streptomyces silvisoli]MDF3292206.1 ATP-grasp peptide maturase system methyltransferase [Streptomyces silvisoli]